MPDGRAPRSDGRIPVPPALVVVVVVVLMGLSGAVGYLLAGQRSVPAPPAGRAAVTAQAAPAPAAPAQGAPVKATPVEGAPAKAGPVERTAVERAPASRASAETSADPAAPPHQAAVRRYLAALDQIGGKQPMASPDVYVQQALSGDTSGIDALITEHERRRAAILRLDPPPPAAEHHAALVRLAEQGITVMRSLKAGITTMDIGALAGLQPQAQQLQVLGDRVTAMENDLRAAYGG